MGGNLDESLLSTASTLIDSCTSLHARFDDMIDNIDASKENNGAQPFRCHGRIPNFATERTINTKGNAKIAYPITTVVSLDMADSATDRSERTTASKLDRLRAKTRLLRKQGTQKIEETRSSLRKARTLSIKSPPAPHPPPYPPPSLYNKVTAARRKQERSEPTKKFEHIPKAKLSDFLRRSNSVIDRLSAEMAMAGSIINQSSCNDDETFNDASANNRTNDFSSCLHVRNDYFDIGKDQKIIQNENDSIHDISIGEDWDESTISATPPGSPSTSSRESRSTETPPQRSLNTSGLPPPEVVVKRINPPDSPLISPVVASPRRFEEVSFSEAASVTFAPRAIVEDRHRRKRPPSISTRGDCASMYNTNQKVEKLAIENDCLKRQLDLLESRHRDSQRKLKEQMELEQEVQEEEHSEIITTPINKTSQSKTYGYHRKKKKSGRRRLGVLLLLTPFLIAATVWIYRSVHTASLSRTNATFAADISGLAYMMPEKVLRQADCGETVFSDNSNDINIDDNDVHDEPDNFVVLHEPPIQYRESDSAKHDESNSGKKASRFKRFVSRIKIRHDQNPMGVWLKKHQQIKTKNHHAEL